MKRITAFLWSVLMVLSAVSFAEEEYLSCSDILFSDLCVGVDGNIYYTASINEDSRYFSRIALYRISPDTKQAELLLTARDSSSRMYLSYDSAYFFEVDAKVNRHPKVYGDRKYYSIRLDSPSFERDSWNLLWEIDKEHDPAWFKPTLTDIYVSVSPRGSGKNELFRYSGGEYEYLFDIGDALGALHTYIIYDEPDEFMSTVYHIYDGKKNRTINIDEDTAYSNRGILLGDQLYMHDREGAFVYDVAEKTKKHIFMFEDRSYQHMCYDDSTIYIFSQKDGMTYINLYSVKEEQLIGEISFETALAPRYTSLIKDKILYNADDYSDNVYVLNLETMEQTVIKLDTMPDDLFETSGIGKKAVIIISVGISFIGIAAFCIYRKEKEDKTIQT